MVGIDRKIISQKAEKLRHMNKQIRSREEEEDMEINEYYQRLEFMYENCPDADREILGLLEEQQGLLNDLCMKKREFQEDVNLFL